MTTTPYPPSGCSSLKVSSTVIAPGARLAVAGSGFDPGSRVELFLSSRPHAVATLHAGLHGTFTTSVIIPSNAPSIETLSATASPALCATQPVRISRTTSGTPTGPPAVAGMDVLGLLTAGAVLVAAGLGAVRGGRRQHRRGPRRWYQRTGRHAVA